MKELNQFEKLVAGYRVPSSKTKDEALNTLQSKVLTSPQKQVTLWNRKRIFAVAASLAFFVILFTFLADSFFTTKKYYSEAGQQIEILLPDDSKVMLGPNSKLRVNYSLISGSRNLKLNGEALFEVQAGKKFTVNFSSGKVEVLGTIFSVSAYKNSTAVVSCLEGNVNVISKTGNKKLNAETGLEITQNGKMNPVEVEKNLVLNELNGFYSWKNEPLNQIFEKLEHRFGYKINAPEPVKLRNFSGDVNLTDLDKACEIIAFAMNLNFTIDVKSKTVNFEEAD